MDNILKVLPELSLVGGHADHGVVIASRTPFARMPTDQQVGRSNIDTVIWQRQTLDDRATLQPQPIIRDILKQYEICIASYVTRELHSLTGLRI